MNVEYPVEVNNYLSGSLDYLLRSSNEIVVIEAKKGDIDKSFNQLSAEMIALDQYEDVNRFSSIYGAITIGDMWRFAVLEREAKKILRDVHSFTIPDDIEEIYSIFIGILEQND
jgi:hypothetical protein